MITRHRTNARMSQIVEYPLSGTMVVLAGQVADEPSGDIREQTADILAKIDRLLSQAGTDKSKIVSAQIWLAHGADFDAMNTVWDAWMPQGCGPARACVESRLADPRLKIEIQVWALK
ncbi:RidA family protein [Microvirga sp. G4-2]|uniref:RidA family protein n=1 Tax=Microvirga sp. G4-2 TaxID=3434467 RepID=UPI004044549B